MAAFEHDGVTLAYDDLGDREASPVVLLHGLSDSRVTWAPLAIGLVGRHRVLPVDLRGHGESGRATGRYRVPDYGGDIAAFCEEVVGGEVTLIGHSLGGITAAYLAATRPDLVRRAFLEDPPMFVVDPEVFPSTIFAALFPVLQQTIRDAQTNEDPEASLAEFLAVVPAMTGEGTLADLLGPEGTRQLAATWAEFDPDAFDVAIDLTIWGDHDVDAPITCPVTLVRADPALGPAFFAEHEERFRRLAPKTTFVLAQGCSHLVHDEQPEWFAAQVDNFLADLST